MLKGFYSDGGGGDRGRREFDKDRTDEEEIEGGFEESVGQELALELLDASPRPTAIVAGNDMIAVGVLNAANRRGVKVPAECPWWAWMASIWPGLSTQA